MPKPYKLPSGRYRAQFRVKGSRHDRVFDTEEEAALYIESCTAYGGDTFASYVELDYKELPAYIELGRNSKLVYNQALSHLMPFFGTTLLSEVSKMQLAKYRAKRGQEITRLGTPVAGRTINNEIGVLSAIMAQADELGRIKGNPIAKSKRVEVKEITEFVSAEERGRLWHASQGTIQVINTPRPRWRTDRKTGERTRVVPKPQPACTPKPYLRMACRFLLIQFDLAARGGEISNIKLNNIDNSSRSVMLYDTKNGADVIKPISPVAMFLITQQEEYLRLHAKKIKNPHKLLFPNRNGGPISYGDMADICTDHALTNPGFHSHLNRGGFVTRGFQLGASTQDLVNVTKHQDERSLAGYKRAAQLTVEERDRVDKLAMWHANDLLSAAATIGGKGGTAGVEVLQDIIGSAEDGDADIDAMDALMQKPDVPTVKSEREQGPLDPIEVLRRGIAAGNVSLDDVMRQLVAK